MIREEIGKITDQASWNRELSNYTRTTIEKAAKDGLFSTTLEDDLICSSELSHLQMLGFTVQRTKVQDSKKEEYCNIISWYNYHPSNDLIVLTKDELKKRSDLCSWGICAKNKLLVDSLVNAASKGKYSITIKIDKLKKTEKEALSNLGYRIKRKVFNYLISWNY